MTYLFNNHPLPHPKKIRNTFYKGNILLKMNSAVQTIYISFMESRHTIELLLSKNIFSENPCAIWEKEYLTKLCLKFDE